MLQNASVKGCDSTVVINLTLLQSTFNNIAQTLCPGESITVNGTVYNASNPSGSETIPGGSLLGCDSTINVNLSFYPPAINNFTQTLCTGGSVTINGTVYDEANPTGIEVVPDGSFHGCDSTIIVNLTFNSVVTNTINETLCTGGSMVVNGTTYDADNPSGTETIEDGSFLGCDSVIFVSLAFSSVVTNTISETLCPDESIIVNGTTYNASNPSGTETIPNGSFLGCDSAIVVNLSFYLVASSTLDDQLCIGGSMMVNGTVYDESNPTGVEILQNTTVNGCDSTVYVNLTFGSSVIVSYEETLCPGEVVFINGTMYSASNPTGEETFPLGSYLGCDSTINISLSYYPEAVGYITEVLQVGGSIVVNGTVYDEQNPTGTEVFNGASYHNCDSTVIISLSFIGGNAISALTQVNSPLCQFGNDGSIVLTGINGGTPPYIVALNGSNSAPVVNFPIIFDNLTFGFHSLTILDATGTVVTLEIFMPDALPFEVDLGGTQTIPLGNNVTLSAVSSTQIISWDWSPSDYLDCTDCPSPTSTPTNDITYTLAVTDINGCTSVGEVSIIVEKKQEVFVPNAFSPNNDGFNDELTIFASPQVERVLGFQIYSRWGEQVFAQFDFPPNDLQFGWNGTFKGEIMDPAVFGWFAEIRFLDGQVRLFKGDVTLVR
ncbi:MAG: gliding motility-associated C-terminal domain-containing protein [Saprospiraceae bacterium]|nr:gliding motility-associated C-terminal domain-containing protein [Saprospiraceae bacterium]